MDLSHFSPKDKHIIQSNPDMSPYDLLHQKGLSTRAYEKLIDEKGNEKNTERSKEEEPITPHSVEPVAHKAEPHKPKLHEIKESFGDTKTVVSKSGIPQRMNTKQAMWLINNFPNEYKLVDDE